MKHLSKIQAEFLKEARKWDDLSYEDQVAYLKRHKGSKRKITARPKQESSSEISKNTKLTPVQQKVFDACEPLIKNLQDNAVQYYESVLQRFKEYYPGP